MFDSILVVCWGNICRSPMGEALLAKCYPSKKIASAGLAAMVGYEADASSIELMQQQGLDIRSHRAQQITEQMVRDFELILVMDEEQKKDLEALYPFACGRVFLFDHFLHHRPIPDPYGLAMGDFEHALQLLEEGVVSWVPYL